MRAFTLMGRRMHSCMLLVCACAAFGLFFILIKDRDSCPTVLSDVTKAIDSSRRVGQLPVSRPFEEGQPHLVYILSYQRCGSTFFGGAFGEHPDVFYAYEPLDGLYSSMYGTAEGWGVPSDITNFKNGTARDLPADELLEVSNFLDDMLHCRTDQFPPEILLHRFWKQFSHEHRSLGRFMTCQRSQLATCHRGIPKECGGRFDASDAERLGFCRASMARVHGRDDPTVKPTAAGNSSISDTDSGNATIARHPSPSIDPFEKYRACMENASVTEKKCRTTFRDVCEKTNFRAIKTVRGTMGSVEDLLRRNPNLRVIHLVRDPRPVMLSRLKFDPSGHGMYSYKAVNETARPSLGHTGQTATVHQTMDVVKEAKLYCSTVARDVRMRKELEVKYPGAIMEVIYDDFAQNPSNYTRRLYDFIGVDIEENVTKWLHDNSEGLTDKTNSSYIASKWQNTLTFYQAKRIDEYCQEFYQEIPYDWAQ